MGFRPSAATTENHASSPRMPELRVRGFWHMTMASKTKTARRVFMVLSPRTLDYARGALRSLLTNALEPIHLHLITDTYSDRQLLIEEIGRHTFPSGHRCEVFSKEDLDDHESRILGPYPKLRLFRN